jgi:hypothetical protein
MRSSEEASPSHQPERRSRPFPGRVSDGRVAWLGAGVRGNPGREALTPLTWRWAAACLSVPGRCRPQGATRPWRSADLKVFICSG